MTTDDGQPDRPVPWPAVAIAAVAVLTVAVILAVCRSPAPPVTTTSTTDTTQGTSTSRVTSTTGGAGSTTSSVTSLPPTTEFDVIVVGDSLGGVTAAISAARQGARTALMSYATFPGGQASASGVASFDEGGQTARRGGIYQELLGKIQSVYGEVNVGGCYFLSTTVCPDPRTVYLLLYRMLTEFGVTLISLPAPPESAVEAVTAEGSTVTGVVVRGTAYASSVLIDATEFGDLYPKVPGLEYVVGDDTNGCLQHVTWPVVVSWYPEGAPAVVNPPIAAIGDLREVYGSEVDRWLDHFRSRVANPPEGMAVWPGWANWDGVSKWSPQVERGYRAIADTRSELIAHPDAPPITLTALNYANDAELSVGAVEDMAVRRTQLARAIHVTYAYLWYLHWELGQVDWGVATHLHFDEALRLQYDQDGGPDLISDSLEEHFPPAPYVREARRIVAEYTLTGTDLAVRGPQPDRFADSVMLGQYFTDTHACDLEESLRSGEGPYEVPLRSFIPLGVDGFLPGLARAAGVDRAAASSLRVHPEEIGGGQVVGTLAGLAVQLGVPPRDVPPEDVRTAVEHTGMPVDIGSVGD